MINAKQQNGNFSLNCESEYVNPDGYIHDDICRNITVYGSELTTNTGTSFNITCGLERRACQDANFKCADSMDCIINCKSGYSGMDGVHSPCEYTQIEGPIGYDLTINCHDNEACKWAMIIGLHASKLDISCSDVKACCNMGMICPPNTNGTKNCFLSGMPCIYIFIYLNIRNNQ